MPLTSLMIHDPPNIHKLKERQCHGEAQVLGKNFLHSSTRCAIIVQCGRLQYFGKQYLLRDIPDFRVLSRTKVCRRQLTTLVDVKNVTKIKHSA